MEELHIGTDASMAKHIDNIVKRDYISVYEDSRELQTTEIGYIYIQSLYQIKKELAEPKLRMKIEGRMNEIANGTKGFKDAIKESLRDFKNLFLHFQNNF